MKVAVLYSGGKDSTLAIEKAKESGWEIQYLLSIKPTRKDCYLFHYATVEHTEKLAKILGIKHYLLTCNVADPKKEAAIVRDFVVKNRVDALILGGTGLQETQLRSLQEALMPFKIEVFAAHAGLDHDQVVREMLDKGYEIMITQVAGDGLTKWLGKTITKQNFNQFEKESAKYGFHIGGEGGYYDTLVLSAPLFKKRLELINPTMIIDGECTGHIIADSKAIEKSLLKAN